MNTAEELLRGLVADLQGVSPNEQSRSIEDIAMAIEAMVHRLRRERDHLNEWHCDVCTRNEDGGPSGWIENRVEGKVPCACVEDMEPYQVLLKALIAAEKERDAARRALELAGEEPRRIVIGIGEWSVCTADIDGEHNALVLIPGGAETVGEQMPKAAETAEEVPGSVTLEFRNPEGLRVIMDALCSLAQADSVLVPVERLREIDGLSVLLLCQAKNFECECDSYHGFTCGKHDIVRKLGRICEVLAAALAGREEKPVNFCPKCQTPLVNPDGVECSCGEPCACGGTGLIDDNSDGVWTKKPCPDCGGGE
jgi:hypothetical protein